MTQYSLSESQNAAPEDGAAGVRYRSFQYRDSVYFQDGQWLTAIFGFILYLLLAIALDAAGHVQSLVIVIPVTAVAFSLGVLMSFSRFDDFFAFSYSMFVGLAFILYLMASIAPAEGIAPFLDGGIGELQARVYYILLRLLDWVDAALSGIPSADNYVFIFEICFLMWWLAYLGAWSIFRHGYTWRAVVPAGVVLLINTYYAPKSTVALLGAFIIVALVLLIRTNLADQQLRWRAQHVYFNQDITWDFLRNGILFSLLVVLAAWLLPGLGRNPQMREFLEPVNDRWESTAQSVQRLYQGLNQQERQAPANFGNSLALGGERNVGDSPVFEVRANQARYWRAVTFDTYDGRQWVNTANEEASYGAGEIIPVASWRAREAISQTVNVLAPVGDVLFGAPDIAQSDIRMKATIRTQAGASPIAVANPEEGSPAVEIAVARAHRDLDHGDRYTFISAATKTSVQDLTGSGEAYPPEIVDRYIQIPQGFSQRVTDLANQLTVGAATPYAKARAIEAYLRTIPYNDAIAAPPEGVDPLEYFLFDIREGYCDYYATAMAMMLRVVGVPARAVSGYAEGIYDEENGVYFVTERDAHTWVEVFFPEYGWIEFEPTAGETPLERPASDNDATNITSRTEEQTPQPESPLGAPTPPAERPPEDLPPQFTGDELLQSPGNDLFGLPWWGWMLLMLLVLPIGIWFIWRARSVGPTAFTPDLPAILYERIGIWTHRLGIGPAVGQTPFEHAAEVNRRAPEAGPYVEELTGHYVQYRFGPPSTGGMSPAHGEDEALLATWKLLEPIFWKTWFKRRWARLTRRSGDNYRLLGPGDKKG